MIVSLLFDGIEVNGVFSAFFAAGMLGILNAFFRPILFLLTLPVTIMSLGLFTFILNGMMLLMASAVIPGFEVHGFWTAIFGTLMISIVSWIINSFINEHGSVDYIDLKHKGNNHWE
jgi:putative membrane protein